MQLHAPVSTGNRAAMKIFDADTGGFVRCCWAWIFAISDLPLREQIPDVATAVKMGDPVEPPAHPTLFIALTREVQITIQALPNSIIVCAPPYVAMLLSERGYAFGGQDDFFDTTPWLRHQAGTTRTVEIQLPIVELGQLAALGESVFD
jgi:hypothetical protein